jgi:hypothetical protein
VTIGPDDPYWDDGYEHDELGEEEELGVLAAPTQTVLSAATTGACTTAVVRGLAEQLVDEVECVRPGTMARIDGAPGVTLGASVFPFLQRPAAESLRGAAEVRALTINSALRTVVQQFVLYSWYRNGRCTSVVSLAAPPGRSNHEAGLAVDVSEYGAVKSTLTARGFRWLGGGDPVHFDYVAGGVDVRYLSVLAFQRLWNRNQPGDRIGEDGAWGPATEARVKQAPSAGFALGASCATGVGGDVAIEVAWQREVDGSYTLRAVADPAVVRVEYDVDGYRVGEITRAASADLAVVYTFDVERAERKLEVRGFDAAGAPIGRGLGLLDVTADTGVVIRQVGRRNYEVGLERAPAEVAAVEVRADGFLLTDATSGTTRSTRGAVRSMFNQLGARSFEITTFAADGTVRGTLRRTFTLE